ncbi:MAG: hypothetical protein R3B84_06060 [Zavarzinella sp.]
MLELTVRQLDHVLDWFQQILGQVLDVKLLLLDRVGNFALLELPGVKLALKANSTALSGGANLVFQVQDLLLLKTSLENLLQFQLVVKKSHEGYQSISISSPEEHSCTFFAWN